jgi:hypothetical protein
MLQSFGHGPKQLEVFQALGLFLNDWDFLPKVEPKYSVVLV